MSAFAADELVSVSVPEMAAMLPGLPVYEKIPEWMSVREIRDMLGLKAIQSIHNALRDGHIAQYGANLVQRYPMSPKRNHTLIHRDAWIQWAFHRNTGPQPQQWEEEEGSLMQARRPIPHLKGSAERLAVLSRVRAGKRPRRRSA